MRERVTDHRETVPAVLAAAVALDPARPLLTWYDDATGERTELSGVTVENWVAKTANLVRDWAGAGPGDRVAALLPPHWQTAAVLLGSWAAGAQLVCDGGGSPVDVAFCTLERVPQAVSIPADERLVLGLDPLAAALDRVPDGFADYAVEVRTQGDRFDAPPLGPDDPALAGPGGGTTHGELCRRAVRRGVELGIGPGDRALIDIAVHADPLDWLLAPLVAGATIVLCGNLDPERLAGRIQTERATVALTAPDAPGPV